MKMSTGDARALADRIRRVIHTDLTNRRGIGDALSTCDQKTYEEINKTQTGLIATEIEAYFA